MCEYSNTFTPVCRNASVVITADTGGTITLENGGLVIEFNDAVDAGHARSIGEKAIKDISAGLLQTGA